MAGTDSAEIGIFVPDTFVCPAFVCPDTFVCPGDYKNELLSAGDGEHLRPKVTASGVPILSAKDVLDGDVVFSECLYVSETDAQKFRKRCDPEAGTF